MAAPVIPGPFFLGAMICGGPTGKDALRQCAGQQFSEAMTQQTNVKYEQHGLMAWFVWSLSALAFFYAFFQRVAPSVMVSDLMAEFTIGAAVTGYLSALYFYPYVALQLPLGALIDRFGVRRILTPAVGLAAVGSYLVGSASNIEWAYAGRVLVGVGSAVGFLASFSLAANWFHPRKFAFLAGMVMLFGMSGGIIGQAPLAALIAEVGWRNAMFIAAGFAAALCLLILVFVREAPPGRPRKGAERAQSWPDILRTMKGALTRGEVWLIALVAMSMTGPLLAFGGLWGVPYLMAAYGLAKPVAAFYASFLLFGWAAGAPLAGWLSDRVGLRKLPMIVAAVVQAVLMAMVVFVPGLPLPLVVAMICAIGMTGGGMVITFAMAREVSPPSIHGTVSGVVNALTVGSGAVLQPVIGVLLDWQWDGMLLDGARVYTPDQFRVAFLALVAWTAVGIILALMTRETRCRQLVGE